MGYIRMRKQTLLSLLLWLGLTDFAWAVRDAINPFEGVSAIFFIIAIPLELIDEIITKAPELTFLLALAALVLSAKYLYHQHRKAKEAEAAERSLAAKTITNIYCDYDPPIKKPWLGKFLATSILLITLPFVVCFLVLLHHNYRINGFIKEGNYQGLKAFVSDCRLCEMAIRADSDFVFRGSFSLALEKNSGPEIFMLLCKNGAICSGTTRLDIDIFKTGRADLIDDFFTAENTLFISSEREAMYHGFVAEGRIDVLQVLAKHKRLQLEDGEGKDPSMNLLNIAIHSHSSNQPEIIRLFKQIEEIKDWKCETPGISRAYYALADAFFANSAQALTAGQITKSELLTPPEKLPSRNDGRTYVSVSPMRLIMNWPQREGWIKKIADHASITVPDLLNEIEDIPTCEARVRFLAKVEPGFGSPEAMVKQYCP